MNCGKKRENIALSCGIFFILFGLFLLIFWEDILKTLIAKKFQLSEKSKTYDPWVRSQVPIFVQYYFFNWTNPGDMKVPDYKPQLEEVGPYKFWEKIEKVNVTWNENGTVSYRRIRRWYFDPEGSNGSLADKITTVNTIPLMAASMSKMMPVLSRLPVNMMIASTQRIFVTKTVSEFLFEGYVDPVLSAGRRWPSTSSKVPYDKFGWFYQRNGSSTFDGIYNVQTGENGMDGFGSMAFWNYKNQTGFFPGRCGQVKGSGGEFWPWNRSKDTNVFLFSPDLCRYIEYKYSEEITRDGLNGFKYVTDAEIFDNGTRDPDNKCFCNGQCLAAGVLNISSCRFGAPVFTSYPHFYLADPIYLKAVEGMTPNKQLHENYIILEPMYGMPMDIAARFQINVFVQPDKHMALLDGIKKVVFPILWLDQRVFVPTERLSAIKVLRHVPTGNLISSIILILVGVICFLSFLRSKISYKKNTVKLSEFRTDDKNGESGLAIEVEKTLLNVENVKLEFPQIKSFKNLGVYNEED